LKKDNNIQYEDWSRRNMEEELRGLSDEEKIEKWG